MLFRLKLISAMLALMMAFVAVNTCALASGDQPLRKPSCWDCWSRHMSSSQATR